MRLCEIGREMWRDMVSGMARAVPMAVAVAFVALCCAGLDAMQIIAIERQAAEFRTARGDVTMVKRDAGINPWICAQLAGSANVQASGALRTDGAMRLRVLPHNPLMVYAVTDGFLQVIDASNADHEGVWLPRALSDKLGAGHGAELETDRGMVRVAGVYEWPEDGRDSRFGYAVVMPSVMDGAFDECWATVWPSAEMSVSLRQTVFASSDPTQAQTGLLNYAKGTSFDAADVFAQRLTRFAVPLAGVITAILAFAACWLRRLELAGDLHAGASKTVVTLQLLGEQLIPTAIGLMMAYALLFVGIRMQPVPDTWAIFLLELRGVAWMLVGSGAGTLLGIGMIRERNLFSLFKAR